jgi:hypothetical protein
MLNFDPHRPFYRALFVIIGTAMAARGIVLLHRVGMSYQNWWGGPVFAPFAIILGIIFIARAIFKPGIFKK